jgi:hypothetical protein
METIAACRQVRKNGRGLTNGILINPFVKRLRLEYATTSGFARQRGGAFYLLSCTLTNREPIISCQPSNRANSLSHRMHHHRFPAAPQLAQERAVPPRSVCGGGRRRAAEAAAGIDSCGPSRACDEAAPSAQAVGRGDVRTSTEMRLCLWEVSWCRMSDHAVFGMSHA